jgi:hypothetical protein
MLTLLLNENNDNYRYAYPFIFKFDQDRDEMMQRAFQNGVTRFYSIDSTYTEAMYDLEKLSIMFFWWWDYTYLCKENYLEELQHVEEGLKEILCHWWDWYRFVLGQNAFEGTANSIEKMNSIKI